MDKSLLLQLFCFLNLIILFQCAEEYNEEDYTSHKAYDLNALFVRGYSSLARNSIDFDDETARSLLDININSIDPEVAISPFGNWSKCLKDWAFILQSIGAKQEWAMRIIDSFGKPESGLLQGNFKWVGDYSECVETRSTNPYYEDGNFRGKYCSLNWFLPPALKVPLPLPFTTGLCVPDSCSTEELERYLNITTHLGGVIFNDTRYDVNATLTCKSTEREWHAPAIAVIFLLSIFGALAVAGSSITAVKYFKNAIEASRPSSLITNISESEQVIGIGNGMKDDTRVASQETLIRNEASDGQANGFLGKLESFLGCFCMFTNGAKLLNTDSSEGQLLCIHGIRFLSMSWVILGHAYAFPFLAGIRNQMEALEIVNTFAFQVVLQGFYSVDSFFVLSGFLLTYLAMKEFAKTKGVISWAQFYIHRYVRLTPVYMLVLGFSASVFFYLGSGPFWNDPEGNYDANCKDSWWMNLLYINNFSKMTEQCMGWSWYLANDMQFFVISPLFLITLWRWPKIGYSLIAAFLAGTFIANFVITYHYDLNAGLSAVIGNANMAEFAAAFEKFNVYFDKIYIKPYTRIGPYLIGILVGYLLFKRKASGDSKHSLVFICIGWIIATAVTLTCVYGLYNNKPTVLGSSFYNALNRTCFAAGLCWVIYVCLIGQGGAVDKILSYKLFIPLSRLTYSAYLIHPMILTSYFGSMKTTFEFSHPTVVYLYLGFMVATYALALPVALILESPIISIEKLLKKSFSKKESS